MVGAPAGPVDVDGSAVVDESVEDGGSGDVVSEVGPPLVPLDVRGDDAGEPVLISGGDDLVEESGIIGHACLSFGSVQTYLVNDEKCASDEGLDGLLQVVCCEGEV